MSESWTQYEGQVIDDKFPLRRYLGGSNHSIVFLTHRLGDSSQEAAIKLIPASSIDPNLQLSRWKVAAQLSHPHLMRLFDMGRCQLDGREWLYVVTENAEENLGQILPERPLTQEELRDALSPTLEAVQYLHSKNLLHGRIKPSNVLVVGDQIKLSADSVLHSAETSSQLPFPSAYDAPECSSGAISPKSDSWSLGMLVVEAFTQKSPTMSMESRTGPEIPDTLPISLLDIVHHTLVQNPEQRWNATDIAAQLNPQPKVEIKTPFVGATASTNVTDRPARTARTAGEQFSKLPPIPPARKQTSPRPSYFLPAAIVVAILVAVLVISNFASRKGRSSSAESAVEATTRTTPMSAAALPSTPTQPSASKPQLKSPEKQPRAQKEQPSQVIPQNSLKNASEKSKIPVAATAPTSAAARPKNSSTKGDVLEQVLPEVSQKARDTIRGTVRVSVRAHVSAAGNVTQSELDSEGSSKYFSDLALQAARRWTFQSPEVEGRSAPSEWVIRFEFTPSDTRAFPRQTNP